MFTLDFLFSMLGVLLSIAFFTLMERKMMGLAHYRKGPSKAITYGITQPIADAMKLLTKESYKMKFYKMMMYFSGPTFSIMLMMLCWMWYESSTNTNISLMKIMVIFSIMSMSAFGFMLTSWGSNSKYAIIGGHRAVAQIISYEVCLVLFILVMIYMASSYSMSTLSQIQENLWFMMFSIPLFLCWILMSMAETNRTPFDLAEGESEIVSGFNIEYGGGMFALIFISEYGMIMFISFISMLFFTSTFLLPPKIMVMCFLFIWVRSSFPRVRYDKLMMMSWKILLPLSLTMLMVTMSVV